MWRERSLVRGHLAALADDPRHLRAHLLDRDVERGKHASGQPLLLTQQSQEDVLGADVTVLERARLDLGEDDDALAAFCESPEHGVQCRTKGTPAGPTDRRRRR